MENTLQTTEILSPAEIITLGVRNNSNLTELKEALQLQIAWETREAEKAYNRAIAAFKANPPQILKESAVDFTSQKGRTNYKYASLANVIEKVTPELSKHGLNISWRTSQNEHINVTCRISHELGHYEETTLCADADNSGNKNSIQAIGSTVTYMQRYTALALLGLACADQDTDGIPPSPAKITEQHLHTLRDLLIAKELSEAKLIEFLKVDSLENLPADQYTKALAAINSAKKVAK